MSGFIYCLNSSTIKPTPILEKIRIASTAGYAAIELWHDDIDAHVASGGRVEDVRKAVDEHGLQVPTTIFLKGWWDTEGAAYATAMDEIRRRLNQAAVVGARHAIAGPPVGKVDFQRGAERYADLLRVGREFGVLPAMEYLGFVEQVNRIEDALRVMEGARDPQATIVLDPFHCYRGGGPIESIRLLKAEQIAISHFNDSPAHPPRETLHDPDRVMPGDGCVDLKKYVSLLHEVGYQRWLSLELFRRDLWERNPLEVARLGLEKMRAVAEA